MQGLEYMVAQDPSDNGHIIENSGVWVIRKQNRRKKQGADDDVNPICSYFVVGENIYMAPSVGNVLGSRVVRASDTIKCPLLSLLYGVAFNGHVTHKITVGGCWTAKVHTLNRTHLPSSSVQGTYIRRKHASNAGEQRKYSYAGYTGNQLEHKATAGHEIDLGL